MDKAAISFSDFAKSGNFAPFLRVPNFRVFRPVRFFNSVRRLVPDPDLVAKNPPAAEDSGCARKRPWGNVFIIIPGAKIDSPSNGNFGGG